MTPLAVRYTLLASVAVWIAGTNIASAQPAGRKTILVLTPTPSRSRFAHNSTGLSSRSCSDTVSQDADVFVETLDRTVFPESGTPVLFRDYLARSTPNRKIDVVITVWDRALNYVLEHRQELFPDMPWYRW